MKENNKSHQKLWQVLAKETFLVKWQTPSLQLFQKDLNPITDNFQVIYLHLRSLCFQVDLKGKSNNFKIGWTLCYSKYFVLYFQPFQSSRGSDWWSIFYETRKNHLVNTFCFRVWMIQGCMKVTEWKHTVESAVHGIFHILSYCN